MKSVNTQFCPHTLNLAFQEVSTLNFAFQALTLNFADYGSVKRVTTVTMGNCKSFLDDQKNKNSPRSANTQFQTDTSLNTQF